jgi:uncharacterized protein (DUF433 family)
MNAPLNWLDIATSGGFTTSDVARLIGRPATTVASWLRGKPPIIEADYEPLNGRPLLSFEALVEARAISHLLGEIKKAKLARIMCEFRKVTGERHPLSKDQKFVTDGFRLFEIDDDRLVNVVNQVYAEPTLMRPLLKGRVVYDNGAARYFMPDPKKLPLVRVDPRHAFGKPVVIDAGRAVTTSAIAASVETEGLAETAEWYGISKPAVRQAVEFERRQAA